MNKEFKLRNPLLKIFTLLLFAMFVILGVFVYFYIGAFQGNVCISDMQCSPSAHARWAEFFSMLGGVGSITSPFVAIVTILFLFFQQSRIADENEKSQKRRELLEELRTCSDFFISVLNEQIHASHIVGELQAEFKKSGVSVGYEILPEVGDIKVKVNNDKSFWVVNNSKFSAWVVLASRIKKEYSIDCFVSESVTGTRFVADIRSLVAQIEYMLTLAGECKANGVNILSVRYHISRIRHLVEIFVENEVVGVELVLMYMAFFDEK
jgi:hypothetical protein